MPCTGFNIEFAVIIRRPITPWPLLESRWFLLCTRATRNVTCSACCVRVCTRGGPGHRKRCDEYASAKSGKSRPAFFSSRVKYAGSHRQNSGRGRRPAPRAKRALNCPKDKDAEYGFGEKNCGTRQIFVTRAFFSFFLPRQGLVRPFCAE